MNYSIELNNPVITAAGKAALVDFYRTLAIDHTVAGGLNAFVTGVDSEGLNVVINVHENAIITAELINTFTRFFKQHSVPWSWFIGAEVSALPLLKMNFHLVYNMPDMYFNLEDALPEIAMASVEIEEAHDDLKLWIKPLQEGFPGSDNCEVYRQLNARLLRTGERKLRHFTAYYQDEPAASATLFLAENAVMLHNLATRNKFKKRGIATALTWHIMSEAKKLGYQHCFLDSSDEGFNLYTRLGFKVYALTAVYAFS